MKQAEAFYKEELAKPIEPTPPSGSGDIGSGSQEE